MKTNTKKSLKRTSSYEEDIIFFVRPEDEAEAVEGLLSESYDSSRSMLVKMTIGLGEVGRCRKEPRRGERLRENKPMKSRKSPTECGTMSQIQFQGVI